MERLCIIPCGKAKIWDKNPNSGPTIAMHAYKSTLHYYCQSYAKRFFNDWVILSAKHGFLFPNDIVPENYDVAFQSNHPQIIDTRELKCQVTEKQLDSYSEIVVLAGAKHQKIVEQIFPQPIKLVYPLKNFKGIGYILQGLKQALEQNKEL